MCEARCPECGTWSPIAHLDDAPAGHWSGGVAGPCPACVAPVCMETECEFRASTMPEPSIPTMPCPECDGAGQLAEHAPDCGAYGACCGGIGVECEACGGTGRIPRPPLTPDQVAALPDGARVVVEDTHPLCLRRGKITCADDRAAAERLVREGVRVWLAKEEADG